MTDKEDVEHEVYQFYIALIQLARGKGLSELEIDQIHSQQYRKAISELKGRRV